jgi:hypothetical protein
LVLSFLFGPCRCHLDTLPSPCSFFSIPFYANPLLLLDKKIEGLSVLGKA